MALMNPHWWEEDPIEFGHYQRDGELLAYSHIWSMLDFTVPWKYLVMRSRHIPARKKKRAE